MDDVAIIGVGLHPFGRFGPKSAIDMGADAIRAALGDAGAAVEGRAVRLRRELRGRQPRCGHRPARASPASRSWTSTTAAPPPRPRSQLTADAIRSGQYDIGVAVGMDKHEPGAFTSDPVDYGAPPWYGEIGHFLTTKFFAMKINRYMHDHGISHETLAKVAAKNYRNGVLNPNAFRRKPISEEDILASRMLNYPLTQYMFCAPDEGAAAVVLCKADLASNVHVDADLPEGHDAADPSLRRLRGARLVGRGRAGRTRRRSTRRRPRTKRRASAPRTST